MFIDHFTKLDAWKKNHELVLEIYIITRSFPDYEKFGLVSQIRRSVSSITANVAEGWGRYHHDDKTRFYYLARGSSTETQNHLILAKDLGYLSQELFDKLKIISFQGMKLINGLIRYTQNIK